MDPDTGLLISAILVSNGILVKVIHWMMQKGSNGVPTEKPVEIHMDDSCSEKHAPIYNRLNAMEVAAAAQNATVDQKLEHHGLMLQAQGRKLDTISSGVDTLVKKNGGGEHEEE